VVVRVTVGVEEPLVAVSVAVVLCVVVRVVVALALCVSTKKARRQQDPACAHGQHTVGTKERVAHANQHSAIVWPPRGAGQMMRIQGPLKLGGHQCTRVRG